MKKRIVKRLVGCAVTLVLTLVGIYYLGLLVRPLNTDIVFMGIDTFHSMPEDSFEVIGYGSSHMWRELAPMELYKKYGIGAYNYGCDWQRINTTKLFLEDSLRTQSPKLVLIEAYLAGYVLQDTDMTGEIYITKALPNSDTKKQYLKQCFGDDKERYLSYYMPLCAFHDDWINITQYNFRNNTYQHDLFKSMGYVAADSAEPITIPDPSAFNQEELPADALEVLDSIVRICDENNISILFYTVPWGGEYTHGDAMKKYAEENNCAYLNLFEHIEEIGLDGDTDFFDIGHLNDSGTIKVTDFLGEYIVNHYDVTDMRTVEGNIWEQALQ
ncbi:MAG: hypothetical protein HFI68_07500 [Lachnospiraceae bacterium]|nr:hypothetical protein [Lachnospiraceae bacterium]